MKKIYLLRHGKAEIAQIAAKDYERVLDEQGVADILEVGKYIKEQLKLPDKILCSGALRTRQTYDNLVNGSGDDFNVEYLDNLYLASVGEIITIAQNTGEDINNLLIIGHNPGVHDFCLSLINGGDEAAILKLQVAFPPACFVVIELDIDDWSQLAPQTGQVKILR